jgi:hypothetical protein
MESIEDLKGVSNGTGVYFVVLPAETRSVLRRIMSSTTTTTTTTAAFTNGAPTSKGAGVASHAPVQSFRLQGSPLPRSELAVVLDWLILGQMS